MKAIKNYIVAICLGLVLAMTTACGNKYAEYINDRFLDKAISSCCSESGRNSDEIEDIIASLYFEHDDDKKPYSKEIYVKFSGDRYYYNYYETYMFNGEMSDELITGTYEDTVDIGGINRKILDGEADYMGYTNHVKYYSGDVAGLNIIYEISQP